jgi:hypothetical protein
MLTIMLLTAALFADPDLTPAPPLHAVTRLGIAPLTPEQYDTIYANMLQAAKLAHLANPDAVAVKRSEAFRVKDYPTGLSIKQRRRLYRLELKWVEAEKDRRNRMASIKVLEAMRARP